MGNHHEKNNIWENMFSLQASFQANPSIFVEVVESNYYESKKVVVSDMFQLQ